MLSATKMRHSRKVSSSPPWSSTTRRRQRSAKSGSVIELAAGGGVELVEVADAEGLGPLGPVHVEQVLDEHAEGRAPVADVVLAQHGVAEEAEDAGQRIADQGAAQVADVHLLGHVR